MNQKDLFAQDELTPEDSLRVEQMVAALRNQTYSVKEIADARTDEDKLLSLAESAMTKRLREKIESLIEILHYADPELALKGPSWFQIFSGRAFDARSNYIAAKRLFTVRLTEARATAQQVDMMLRKIDAVIGHSRRDAAELRLQLKAAQLFLERTTASADQESEHLDFVTYRDAIARRAVHLAALLAASEMSLPQLQRVRADTATLLAQFRECSDVLVPLWRKHALTLWLTMPSNGKAISAAKGAYSDLKTKFLEAL